MQNATSYPTNEYGHRNSVHPQVPIPETQISLQQYRLQQVLQDDISLVVLVNSESGKRQYTELMKRLVD